MSHEDSRNAAAVLSGEIAATRRVIDAITAALAALLPAGVTGGFKEMPVKNDVFEDLYFPHESRSRS